MLALLKKQDILSQTGALSVGASGPLRPLFVEYEPESEPQTQSIKAPESIDSIIRAETSNHLKSDKLAKTVADYPFSITSSNSPTSYLLFQAQQQAQTTQESSIELPKSFSTQPTYSSFAQTTVLAQSNLSYTTSFTSVEFYSASFSYAYSKEQSDTSSTYLSSTSLFKEVTYSTEFTSTETYRPSSSTKEQITIFEPAQSYIPSTSQVEIISEQKQESTYTSQPTTQLTYQIPTQPEPTITLTQEPTTSIYAKSESLLVQEAVTISPLSSLTIPSYETTPEVKTLNLSDYQPNLETLETTKQIQLKVDVQQLSQPEITITPNLENLQANPSTKVTIYQPESSDTTTINVTPYTTLESAVEQPETKVSQNFQSIQSNLSSLESAFDPIKSNLKQTNNNLYKVHENGENYRRDFLNEITVTNNLLTKIKDYSILTDDGKSRDISNSALAAMDLLLKESGIQVTYKFLESVEYGQIVEGISIEFSEADKAKVAEVFGVDVKTIGLVYEVNGEEPNRGKTALNQYTNLKEGDKLQLAFVAQGLYHKKSKDGKSTDHISTTEGVKSKYSGSANCTPDGRVIDNGYSLSTTCTPDGRVIVDEATDTTYVTRQSTINLEELSKTIQQNRRQQNNDWLARVYNTQETNIYDSQIMKFKMEGVTVDQYLESLEKDNIFFYRVKEGDSFFYKGHIGSENNKGNFKVIVQRKDQPFIDVTHNPLFQLKDGDMVVPIYESKK